MKVILKVLWLFMILTACKDRDPQRTKVLPHTTVSIDSIALENLDSVFCSAKENQDYKRALKIRLRQIDIIDQKKNNTQSDSLIQNLIYLSQQVSYRKLKGKVRMTKAKHFENKKKYDSAYFYYDIAQKFFERSKDSTLMGKSLIAKSNIQRVYGDYLGTQKAALKSLELLKPNDTLFRIKAHNLIAISSKKLKQYDDAEHWYKEALTIDPGFSSNSILKNNLALVYLYKENYGKALNIWKKIKDDPVLNSTAFRRNRIMDNIGFAYAKSGQRQRGLEMMRKAYQIRLEHNDRGGEIVSALHFAEVYTDIEPEKSFHWAEKALEITANPVSQIKAYLLMGKSNYKNTSEYLVKYDRLRDSLEIQKQLSGNKFAKIRFESEKKQAQILELKNLNHRSSLEVERERHYKLLSILSSIFILITALLLIIFLIHRHKKNKRLALYQKERQLSKNLHDGVSNDIYHLMNTLENNPNNHIQTNVMNHLDDIYQRTRQISREMDTSRLLRNYPDRLSEMIENFNNQKINILTRHFSESLFIGLKNQLKIDIYRILQELLTNTYKHSGADLIVIQFKRTKKNLTITYRDNGSGFENNRKKVNNGLENVENRTKRNNGHITFENKTSGGVLINLFFSL